MGTPPEHEISLLGYKRKPTFQIPFSAVEAGKTSL